MPGSRLGAIALTLLLVSTDVRAVSVRTAAANPCRTVEHYDALAAGPALSTRRAILAPDTRIWLLQCLAVWALAQASGGSHEGLLFAAGVALRPRGVPPAVSRAALREAVSAGLSSFADIQRFLAQTGVTLSQARIRQRISADAELGPLFDAMALAKSHERLAAKEARRAEREQERALRREDLQAARRRLYAPLIREYGGNAEAIGRTLSTPDRPVWKTTVARHFREDPWLGELAAKAKAIVLEQRSVIDATHPPRRIWGRLHAGEPYALLAEIRWQGPVDLRRFAGREIRELRLERQYINANGRMSCFAPGDGVHAGPSWSGGSADIDYRWVPAARRFVPIRLSLTDISGEKRQDVAFVAATDAAEPLEDGPLRPLDSRWAGSENRLAVWDRAKEIADVQRVVWVPFRRSPLGYFQEPGAPRLFPDDDAGQLFGAYRWTGNQRVFLGVWRPGRWTPADAFDRPLTDSETLRLEEALADANILSPGLAGSHVVPGTSLPIAAVANALRNGLSDPAVLSTLARREYWIERRQLLHQSRREMAMSRLGSEDSPFDLERHLPDPHAARVSDAPAATRVTRLEIGARIERLFDKKRKALSILVEEFGLWPEDYGWEGLPSITPTDISRDSAVILSRLRDTFTRQELTWILAEQHSTAAELFPEGRSLHRVTVELETALIAAPFVVLSLLPLAAWWALPLALAFTTRGLPHMHRWLAGATDRDIPALNRLFERFSSAFLGPFAAGIILAKALSLPDAAAAVVQAGAVLLGGWNAWRLHRNHNAVVRAAA